MAVRCFSCKVVDSLVPFTTCTGWPVLHQYPHIVCLPITILFVLNMAIRENKIILDCGRRLAVRAGHKWSEPRIVVVYTCHS